MMQNALRFLAPVIIRILQVFLLLLVGDHARCAWTDTLYARHFTEAASKSNDELFTFTCQMCDDRRRKKWWTTRQASPAFHLPRVLSKYHSMR
jgi:hypothetical protein